MRGKGFCGQGATMFWRLTAIGCAFLVIGCAFFVTVATVSAETTPVPADSRLKTIVAKKVIRIAYRADARPFAFLNDAKEPLGYTIDLCKQVTKSIEQQFGLPELKIEWVPVTVETRFSAVAGGKADIECGSSTVTLGRMKEVDFSIFVFVEFDRRAGGGGLEYPLIRRNGREEDRRGPGTTNEQAVNEQVQRAQAQCHGSCR